VENIIKEAIENKKVIEFIYKNDIRVVEPFVLGVSSTGKVSVRAYQVGGNSTDSNTIGWKMFTLDKMSNLQVKSDDFTGLREHYNSNDSALNPIYARV
jgi:predicted DNA-binding transcriptional regulator YafY